LEVKPNSSEPMAAAAPVKTRGEKLFDWLTYGGLNGVGTFIITIPFADWGNRKVFDSWSKGLVETFKLSKGTARTAVSATTLGIGGTVMLLPVYIAEHYKKPISEWLNRRFGNEQEQKMKVENLAPQTVGSLIKGRLVAWCAVFSGFKGAELISKAMGKGDALQQFEQRFGEKVCKVLDTPMHDKAIMETARAEGKSLENAWKLAETKTYRYGKLGALDIFATTAATSILYVTSRIFAKRREAARAERETMKPLVKASVAADLVKEDTSVSSGLTDMPVTMITGDKQNSGAIHHAAAQHGAQI
jgi:hypothetical protein